MNKIIKFIKTNIILNIGKTLVLQNLYLPVVCFWELYMSNLKSEKLKQHVKKNLKP